MQLLKHSTFLDHPVPVVRILVRTRKQAVVSTCVPTPGALDTFMTLTFDLLTSGLVHAKVLSWTICLPTLVLIAQAVFLLESGPTDRQTDRQT